MARKSNVAPQEITDWLGKIKYAEEARDEADKEFGYTRAHQQYVNDYYSAIPSFVKDVKMVPINEVYAYARTFIPSIYSRDPYITVNPRSANGARAAKIRELFVNAYWRELQLKREVRRIILDAVLAEGWIKLGYANSMGRLVAKDGETQLEPSEFIKNEEIFATRVSWKNMVRDPDATNGLHDARFVAQNIIRPLAAIKASSLYEHTSDLQPSFIKTGDKKSKLRGGSDVEYGSLWEVWDIDNAEVFTVSEGSTHFLMKKKWPYEIDGYPFSLLRFNDNPDKPYAPNLIGSWEPQLWEKMKIRAMELDHIKRFNRQMSIEEGSHSNAEIQRMEEGRSGSIIRRKKGAKAPEPIPYPPIQADIYGIEGRIDLDKDNISGQPNAVRSAPQKTQSRTLGEIDRLIAAFGARQNEPQTLVEEFCEEVSYKLIGIAAQYLPGDKYVRATKKDMQAIGEAFLGDDGKARFDGRGFKFTKKDIQGTEFDVQIKSGSTLPLNRENRTQILGDLLKLGPTLGIGPNSKLAKTVGKALLSELDMPEIEAAFDEDLREMENAKKMMQATQQAELSQADMRLKHLQGQSNGM